MKNRTHRFSSEGKYLKLYANTAEINGMCEFLRGKKITYQNRLKEIENLKSPISLKKFSW